MALALDPYKPPSSNGAPSPLDQYNGAAAAAAVTSAQLPVTAADLAAAMPATMDIAPALPTTMDEVVNGVVVWVHSGGAGLPAHSDGFFLLPSDVYALFDTIATVLATPVRPHNPFDVLTACDPRYVFESLSNVARLLRAMLHVFGKAALPPKGVACLRHAAMPLAQDTYELSVTNQQNLADLIQDHIGPMLPYFSDDILSRL